MIAPMPSNVASSTTAMVMRCPASRRVEMAFSWVRMSARNGGMDQFTDRERICQASRSLLRTSSIRLNATSLFPMAIMRS